jgi:integrase/recombinase XerC
MTTLSECIDRYLTAASIHLAASSIKTYDNRLKYLKECIGETKELEQIHLLDLEKATAEYRKKHSANSTALAITVIKQFFLWCVEVELIKKSPAEKLRSPKREQKAPRTLGKVKFTRLLDEANKHLQSDDWRVVRNASLVLFLSYTGLRRAEAAALKWKDIDLEEKTLFVLGKGNKEHRSLLHSKLIPILKRLQEAQGRNYGAVFAKEDGTGLHPYTLNAIFRRWVCAVIKVDCTPHQLRHSFASELMEEGATLDEARDLLRHKSVATTQIYVSTSPERLRGALERLK